MPKERIMCSGEKSCGCVVKPKMGEVIVNERMKECARFITGFAADKYCCITREQVHIIK